MENAGVSDRAVRRMENQSRRRRRDRGNGAAGAEGPGRCREATRDRRRGVRRDPRHEDCAARQCSPATGKGSGEGVRRVRARFVAVPGEYGPRFLNLSTLPESVAQLRDLVSTVLAELQQLPLDDEDDDPVDGTAESGDATRISSCDLPGRPPDSPSRHRHRRVHSIPAAADLTVSQWADQNRRLSATSAEPGNGARAAFPT
jgi:hypothetical protein